MDRKFSPIQAGSWRGLVSDQHAHLPLAKLFDGGFPAPGFPGTVEKIHGNVGTTYLISLGASAGPPLLFYAKHFQQPIGPAVKGIFRETGAARSWKAVALASAAGLPAPHPVALLERKSFGLVREGVFISEAIAGRLEKNLEVYFRRRFDAHPLTPGLRREKRLIIEAIAGLFRAAHTTDTIYFPDFHPHNMVIRMNAEGSPELFLVDFDEVKFGVRKGDQMRNLASLGRNSVKVQKKMSAGRITTGDRLRFLRAYLGPGASRDEVHALWAKVLKNWEKR